jgi:hypothetical protein
VPFADEFKGRILAHGARIPNDLPEAFGILSAVKDASRFALYACGPMLKTPRGNITDSFDSIIVLATFSRWRH